MRATKPTDIATELKEVRLRGGHVVEIASTDDTTLVRMRSAGATEGLDIEIAWSPQGPVARVRAARVDLQTTEDLHISCKRFAVEASHEIALQAKGDFTASGAAVAVEARTGRVVARANDDVQLLGEQILLNCDRTPELPDWVQQAPGSLFNQLVALADASGDKDLITALRGEQDGDHAP